MSQSHQSPFPLSETTPGDIGRISKIDNTELEVALLKMGISTGDICRVSGIAPLGDPIALLVGRTKVSLRKQDAKHIWILPQQ
ncbi:MAG: FeoA family protein [Bacteroidota bacterium]